MRKVAQIMGLPITVDIPNCDDEKIFSNVFDWFREVDQRFSTYKPDSEVSRYRRGDVTKPSRVLEHIIKACKKAEQDTAGYFSAWAGITDSADGRGGAKPARWFDPSGYVKGWAIKKAGKNIENMGYETYCIGAGGDVLARSDSEKDWSVGIENPLNKTSIVGYISGKNFAVATSGSYERGAHITNPKTGRPADELMSFSVTGKNIMEADILATAGFAAGTRGVNLVGDKRGYAALAIDAQGRVTLTGPMEKLLRTA